MSIPTISIHYVKTTIPITRKEQYTFEQKAQGRPHDGLAQSVPRNLESKEGGNRIPIKAAPYWPKNYFTPDIDLSAAKPPLRRCYLP